VAEEKQEKGGLKTTTVAELGMRLPIGLAGSTGGLSKDLVLRRWTFKEERALGRLRSEHETATLPEYVNMVCGTVASRLGAVDLDKLDTAARRMIVSTMYMADVWYTYVRARIEAIGPELKLDFKCPRCKNDIKWAGDLLTAEVRTLDSPAEGEWEVQLKHPLQARGMTIAGFRLGQMRWTALEQGGSDVGPNDQGASKLMVIMGSIIGFMDEAGKPTAGQLIESELEQLSKIDIERLCTSVDEHSAGPDLSMKLKCPHARCKHDIVMPLDWRYDSFFGVSSA
jgi:hypothetical protein